MIEPTSPASPPPASEDAALETLWARVLESWDDDKRHGAVLEYALHANRLPDLGGRYRALKDDPEKGERAKKQIDAIVAAATQMMLAMKTPKRTKPPPGMVLSVAGICVVLLAWLAYALWRSMGR